MGVPSGNPMVGNSIAEAENAVIDLRAKLGRALKLMRGTAENEQGPRSWCKCNARQRAMTHDRGAKHSPICVS
jgi:hypothetical protein